MVAKKEKENETPNLEFWDSVFCTDPKYAKKITGSGAKLTAIDAYYQIQKATELWGQYGVKWGIEADGRFTVHNIVMMENGAAFSAGGIIIYEATLYFPSYNDPDIKGQIPIHSSLEFYGKRANNNLYLDDDCVKKVATNALSKGLSKLGFNGDVFMGKFDDDKYIKSMKEKFSGKEPEDLKPGDKQTTLKNKVKKEGEEQPPPTGIPKPDKQLLITSEQKKELNDICNEYHVTPGYLRKTYNITNKTPSVNARLIMSKIRQDLDHLKGTKSEE